jgi:site-specific DNA recombinase
VLDELKQIVLKSNPVLDDAHRNGILTETKVDTMKSEIDMLRNKISEADAAVQNLLSAISKGENDEVIAIMMKRMEELSNDRRTYKKRLAELQNIEKASEFDGTNLELMAERLIDLDCEVWKLMAVEDKRRMVRSAVEKILWDGKKIDIMLWGCRCGGTIE